jgi:hypothetical protein
VDAHKKDLFIAMLIDQTTPVTWTVPNELNAVRRLVRKIEREAPGPCACVTKPGPAAASLERPPSACPGARTAPGIKVHVHVLVNRSDGGEVDLTGVSIHRWTESADEIAGQLRTCARAHPSQ